MFLGVLVVVSIGLPFRDRAPLLKAINNTSSCIMHQDYITTNYNMLLCNLDARMCNQYHKIIKDCVGLAVCIGFLKKIKTN